jgi:hypothetical protein
MTVIEQDKSYSYDLIKELIARAMYTATQAERAGRGTFGMTTEMLKDDKLKWQNQPIFVRRSWLTQAEAFMDGHGL